MKERTVSAESFCGTLLANVRNEKITDEGFRNFCVNTLPIVEFPRPDDPPGAWRADAKKHPDDIGWWLAVPAHAPSTRDGEVIGVRVLRSQVEAIGLVSLNGPKTMYDFKRHLWVKLELPN